MKNLIHYIILGLVLVALLLGVYSCVLNIRITHQVEQMQKTDDEMMDRLAGSLVQPETLPNITDSLAWYVKEDRTLEVGYKEYYKCTIHRFFFKRANYTDSLFNGFSIVVADLNERGIIVDNQENVIVSGQAMGKELVNWKSKLDSLTHQREFYSDYSEKGLTVRTYIRTNKI